MGRTPEYLGKKIQSYDVKMAMLALLVLALSILGFCRVGRRQQMGHWTSLNNAGPHGLSEILYAFSSANGNNGSAFAGLNANTPWLNTTHRPGDVDRAILNDCAHHGVWPARWRGKKISPPSAGTFPVSGVTFVILLLGTVLLVGALNFLPALTLGPIVEHFLTNQGKLF